MQDLASKAGHECLSTGLNAFQISLTSLCGFFCSLIMLCGGAPLGYGRIRLSRRITESESILAHGCVFVARFVTIVTSMACAEIQTD